MSLSFYLQYLSLIFNIYVNLFKVKILKILNININLLHF